MRLTSITMMLPSLYRFFHGSEIEEEDPDLFPGLLWSPSKQDHRGLSFVPQSQDAAEIGVGGNQSSIFARSPGKNFVVGSILHAVIAHVSCVVASGPKPLCNRGR